MSATGGVDVSAAGDARLRAVPVAGPGTGLAVAAVLFLVGFVIDAAVLVHWLPKDLRPISSLRPALPAMTLMILGARTGFAASFLNFFSMERQS